MIDYVETLGGTISTAKVFQSDTRYFVSGATPFQSSGAGNYYLKSDSAFRGAGTTSISSTQLNALKTKTTQPPLEFRRFMEVSGELTLFPQVPRYVAGAPDLGYWYDVLDFTVAAMVLDGGRIMVQPGTANRRSE